MHAYEITYICEGVVIHRVIIAQDIPAAIEDLELMVMVEDVLGIIEDMKMINSYRDYEFNKWVVSRNGLEAIDASLVRAVAILIRMETNYEKR